ncbi:benzoylformate decarboxylase [Pseudonocardia sp. EC080610-09]|uniref:benzoylformate decarboxylase n=1 Tax=unclassified Pseudonocardia TaxID=2619320 RepID=UPI0006CAF88A|nr:MULTISPECIES: benzoylformate decarboxylase [unclassified Pseudonocardia]ALE73746.1 benzoylformate decarboxylase [Pseudonocardia sp. EC080625-04]ALL77134.1 benzoylformate decarboxylase [Pseudonocardia sp. EC080610-09]ALL80048.1 benzoylformate decarboxylase [Pseudonocardia sp. EC080619-01]
MATIGEAGWQVLHGHGIDTVFGNPGSNELPFLAAMPDGTRYVLGLHEGVVVGMADGYAQATGRPALVNLHAASGSGNAMGALTNAVYSHSPLVLTAGQQVRSTVGQEVMLTNVDAAALPRPLVKWSAEPVDAQDVPRALSQAVHTACLEPRGPVYLSVPYDDWAAPAGPHTAHLPGRRTVSAAALDPAQTATIAGTLASARNPVLVLGPQADADRAAADAVALAERLACPVWVAPSASRCPFPTRHPSFRGVLPASVRDVTERLAGHDVVLVAGAPVFRYHQFLPGDLLPEGARLLHLTADPAEAARAPMGDAWVAPVGAALAALAAAVPDSGRDPLPPRPAFATPAGADDHVPPEQLFALVREAAPAGTVHVCESTSTIDAFFAQADLTEPGSYLFPASGGLGFGLPAAVGAQLAHTDEGGTARRRVVALVGDGSANYGITALWTAAQYRVPVVFVILKNGTYGALRGFAGLLGTGETPGLDVPGLDFVRIAEGYGVPAVSARDAGSVAAALKEAFDDDGPRLVEVVTAPGIG